MARFSSVDNNLYTLEKGVQMKYIEKIQKLMDSNITSYKIAKNIGVPVQTIDRYRNGSLVENMKLGIAEKLIDYIESLESGHK